jgi:membrane protease YdiL (CAAX protease family)
LQKVKAMSSVQPESLIQSTVLSIIIFGIIAIILHYVARRKELFNLDDGHWDGPHWRFWQVAILFLIYIFVSSLITPIVLWFIGSLGVNMSVGLRIAVMQWITVGFTGLLFWLFAISMAKGCAQSAWKNDHVGTVLQDIGYGVIFWIIAIPVVIVTMQFFELLSYFAFGSFGVEQVSVKYLRNSISDPFLLSTALIAIIFGAPFIEEFLFRGCLQGWIRRSLGPKLAVVITSIIFALFHYSPAQKIGNIPIIASLFVFSLYLGWSYEKRRSLWTPITLHLVFNATSVLYILGNLGVVQ